MHYIGHFLLAGLLFLTIDSIWLKFVANSFYKKHLGKMLAAKPNFVAAGLFYVLYIIGMLVFAIEPALDQRSLSFAGGHGALLGLVMYATYDLTNHATLKNWPTIITVVDMAWGTLITGVVCTLSYVVLR